MKKSVNIEYMGPICLIEINRPDKMNALNQNVLNSLKEIVEKINNDEKTKIAIITGAGDRSFSAGADLNEVQGRTPLSQLSQNEASYIIYELKRPIIAMIKGYALGGGYELALACDIRICSENAKFGFPEIKMGWIPGGGGTQLLPRILGEGNAMELLLTGRIIDAIEAKEIGIVNHMFPLNKIKDKTLELAREIAKNNLTGLMFTKDAVRKSRQLDICSGLLYEKHLTSICFSDKSTDQNIKEFFNK